MATQTGSIDMAAMAEAAKTANNYVTDLGSSGIRVHPSDDTDNYAAIDANGMSVVRNSESVAHFGESTRIGKSGESHMELDFRSMRMVDREGTEFFEIEDMRGSEGYVIINDRFVGTSERRGFTLTLPSDDTDYTVTVDGVIVTPTLKMVDFFIINPAPAIGAEVIATYKTSSNQAKSFTIGTRDEGVVGACSIAEGYAVVASGFTSHAEGVKTVSSGDYSHAEGSYTAATGDYSHAEGASVVADGVCSHAQNSNTKAGHDNQTAIGMFNDNDIANAFEIGNGTSSSNRSNAFAVRWDGTICPNDEPMPDWVVAQGTSGIWTYRKWHSGIAECWGTYTASIAVGIASASYGGYRSDQITATAWPTGMFVAAPLVTATVQSGGGTWVNNMGGSDTTSAKFFLSCGASMAAANRSIAIHAIGRWK